MRPLQLDFGKEHRPARPLPASGYSFIDSLRVMSMSCRAKPRADLFEACALLHVSRSASQAAHMEALMRCLDEALGKAARLHAPGTAEMTFDESWLVQLGRAMSRGDDASISFLLRSRVRAEHRRLIRFLLTRVVESFSLV